MIEPQVAHLQARCATSFTRRHAIVATAVRRRARCALSVDGRQASSHRTIAFWIGIFNAAGRPRMEPSIRAHDVNWLASDIGGLS